MTVKSHKEELKKLVQELKDHGKENGTKITNEFIAEAMGYNRSYFSQLLGEKGVVTEDHIKDFKLHFPYRGQEEKPETFIDKRRNHKLNHVKEDDIGVYQAGTRGSFIDLYEDENTEVTIGSLNSSIFPGCDLALKVTGSSMYPMIVNQSVIVGERLQIDARGISSGEIYAVHTKQGLKTCKYVHILDSKPGFIRLVALSKSIPPQTVAIEDIILLMRVYFIINPS